MGVQRFRAVEDMDAAAVVTAERDGFERFVRHCARYWAIAPRRYPRGVFKFRSVQQAQEAREKISLTNRTSRE